MAISVSISKANELMCRMIGIRQAWKFNDVPPKYRGRNCNDKRYEDHMIGAIAEFAVAKHLELPWIAEGKSQVLPDVGHNIDVKGSTFHTPTLFVTKTRVDWCYVACYVDTNEHKTTVSIQGFFPGCELIKDMYTKPKRYDPDTLQQEIANDQLFDSDILLDYITDQSFDIDAFSSIYL